MNGQPPPDDSMNVNDVRNVRVCGRVSGDVQRSNRGD